MGVIEQQKSEAGKKVMRFFSSLADETRLKILLGLAGGPKNVGRIHASVGKDKITLSAVSHQLKLLADMGIVSCERKGKERFFRLSNNFCWCILRDAFKQFNMEINVICEKCGEKPE